MNIITNSKTSLLNNYKSENNTNEEPGIYILNLLYVIKYSFL